MKFILLIFLGLLSFNAAAENFDCGEIEIAGLYSSPSTRTGSHSNKFMVLFGEQKNAACENINFGHVSYDDPAAEGIQSLVTAAFLSGKALRVVVEDGEIGNSQSYRILFVNLKP